MAWNPPVAFHIILFLHKPTDFRSNFTQLRDKKILDKNHNILP